MLIYQRADNSPKIPMDSKVTRPPQIGGEPLGQRAAPQALSGIYKPQIDHTYKGHGNVAL